MKSALSVLRQLRSSQGPLSARGESRETGIDYECLYAEIVAEAGGPEDSAAIRHHVALNGQWVMDEIAEMDRRCDRLARAGADRVTYRAAVLILVARLHELRDWHDGTPVPLDSSRLVVVVNTPVQGPVELSCGIVITNVARFIGRVLTALDCALRLPERSGAGEDDAVVTCLLDQLRRCGLQASVEDVP